MTIAALITATVPHAVRALSLSTAKGTEADSAARQAVRGATAWFLGLAEAPDLKGQELHRLVMGDAMTHYGPRCGFSRDDAAQMANAMQTFVDGVRIAATGEQQAWGAVRPKLLSPTEAEFWLRTGIQTMIWTAFYLRTHDVPAADAAQSRCSRLELQPDQLIAALGEPAA